MADGKGTLSLSYSFLFVVTSWPFGGEHMHAHPLMLSVKVSFPQGVLLEQHEGTAMAAPVMKSMGGGGRAPPLPITLTQPAVTTQVWMTSMPFSMTFAGNKEKKPNQATTSA